MACVLAIASAASPLLASEVRRASLDFLDLDGSSLGGSRSSSGFTPLTPDQNARRSRSGVLQCVPYARQVSGIQIYGNAHTWWASAQGRYARGEQPRVGAVLALQATGAMPLGHVAVVKRIVSDREIILDHANWSGPGVIDRSAMAIDVSDDNDWSQVRIWFGPTGKMGARVNPAYGFIYPQGPALEQPVVRFASAEAATEKTAKREARRADAAPRLAYASFAVDDLDDGVTSGTARTLRFASRR